MRNNKKYIRTNLLVQYLRLCQQSIKHISCVWFLFEHQINFRNDSIDGMCTQIWASVILCEKCSAYHQLSSIKIIEWYFRIKFLVHTAVIEQNQKNSRVLSSIDWIDMFLWLNFLTIHISITFEQNIFYFSHFFSFWFLIAKESGGNSCLNFRFAFNSFLFNKISMRMRVFSLTRGLFSFGFVFRFLYFLSILIEYKINSNMQTKLAQIAIRTSIWQFWLFQFVWHVQQKVYNGE